MDHSDPEAEIALVNCRGHRLTLKVQLDIAVFTGCYSSLQRKRDLRVDIGWLSRDQRGAGHRVHVGRVELCHHNGVCPGRVGDAEAENAILETGPGVDGRKPVKTLVPLLVGIAVAPVDDLLGRYGLFPYEGEIAGSRSCFYERFIPIFL